MGYSPQVIERMLAYVPKGKSSKFYSCRICGVRLSYAKMKDHLEHDHERKVESAGYVFYEIG